MYYVAKALQAAGLGVMALGFMQNYPRLLPRGLFLISIVLFLSGWLIQTYVLKR